MARAQIVKHNLINAWSCNFFVEEPFIRCFYVTMQVLILGNFMKHFVFYLNLIYKRGKITLSGSHSPSSHFIHVLILTKFT
jgi:hypothetical protein